MKIKSIFFTVFFFISILLIQSCDTKETSVLDTNATTSRIQLQLVDAPDDNYDQVWVEIIDVKYNRNDDEEGWTSFDGYPKETGDMVDLTNLIAGSSHILTDQEIESGMLSQVRLVLGENNYLVLKGENDELSDDVPLKTPSAQQSGLKLTLNTELVAGYSYTFTLDWDVQKSIVKAGTSGNYNLKPVIRVVAEANSGSIFGSVADSEEVEAPMPIGGAQLFVYPNDGYTPGEEVTSTWSSDIEGSEGEFMIQGLPGGATGTIYFLRVVKSDYESYNYGSVMVENGTDTNVGTILLTKSTGSIIGNVTDELDVAINEADVLLYLKSDANFENGILVNTDVEGNFEFDKLLPNEYVLKIVKTGFDEFIYVGTTEGIIVVIINEQTDLETLKLTTTP